MSKKVEAQVALCKCREGNVFGVRFEKRQGVWTYDWAFKIKETEAREEGYESTKILGLIYPDPEYPGCPFCENQNFIVCDKCGKLNCRTQTEGLFTCRWCGQIGRLEIYNGSGVNGAGDI